MDGFEAFAHLFVGRDPLALGAHARTLETICVPRRAATGRWRRRCGTSPGERWASPWPRCWAAPPTGSRSTRRSVSCARPSSAPRTPARWSHDGFRAVKVRIARDRDRRGDRRRWRRCATPSATPWRSWSTSISGGGCPATSRPGLDAQARAPRHRRVWPSSASLWVEEPLAGDDLAGMRMLREATGVRIAGGEMARDFDHLRRALEADALDVLQPDVVLALGISGARTLADLALRRNRWFTPHTWTNGIGLLANLHVCCGVGGGPYLEYPYDPPGWTPERRDFMLAQPVVVDGEAGSPWATRPGSASSSTRRRWPTTPPRPRHDDAHRGIHRRALRARRRRPDICHGVPARRHRDRRGGPRRRRGCRPRGPRRAPGLRPRGLGAGRSRPSVAGCSSASPS